MRERPLIAWLLAALILAGTGIAVSQDANQSRNLIINGQPAQVPVITVNGRSYVDLAALARAVNGTLSFGGNQIALTLSGAPVSTAATPAAAPAQAPASNPGFSRGFLQAGIEQMATLREWHSALASAIVNGFPVTANWIAPYRAQAMTGLRLVSTAVTTDADRSAYQLLNNEFQNMAKLSDKYIAKRANLTYVSPDALQNDDLNQRIVNCGHSLASMAASGQFVDDGSCH
jgi:hypothetical protein